MHEVNIAIIPARGGSKRIPRKNIKDFCGKPLIAYSIEAALQSGLFDKIIVSTDDEEIATVAKQYGAEVPFLRPRELSDDFTGTIPVIKHAIEATCKDQTLLKAVCCIYATAPFVQPYYIQEAYAKLKSTQSAYAFSATTYAFPIQRAIKLTHDHVEMFDSKHFSTRSQDLEEAYHDAGQFYWGTPEAWMEEKIIFAPHSTAVLLPRHLVQDIDTGEDWVQAELMYKALHENTLQS
ncbi:pseudaminic acid cytidylyltransferase [Sulfurospirillum halorespirans]|uniref:pseudaminic acid cytidylyltransferase n=1 Tax=Sulfurospirillum halorespirans TaxID=194424 RepID=UPI001930FCD8|nr:pseudaminic acid cytidylyltransferase [Sulfurospirillum halorespirans]